MDYCGSIIQTKDQIYRDICSRYSEHKNEYIESKLDMLYATKFINNEVSVSGWMVFVGPEVVKKIDKMIQLDLEKSKVRLLLAKCLVPRDDISFDIIESMSKDVV